MKNDTSKATPSEKQVPEKGTVDTSISESAQLEIDALRAMLGTSPPSPPRKASPRRRDEDADD